MRSTLRVPALCLAAALMAGCAGGLVLDKPIDWKSLGIDHVPAASEYPDDPAVILLDEGKMEIVGSGEVVNSVFERHTIVKILTAGGQRYANIAVPYASGSSVENIRARTITPAGRIRPLEPADVYDVSLYPNFVFYSDQRAKIFTLPAVEEGSLLEYDYQIEIRGRSFWPAWEFQSSIPVLHSRFTLVRPSQWPVDSRLYGIAIQPREVKVPQGFKATTVWEAHSIAPLRPEPGMPPAHELKARLAIAPLGVRSWDDVARWYLDLASPRMKAGPEVRALAESLTAGLTGDREKLRSIYNGVRDRVRYMSVEIGIGGFQPHAAEEVCSRLYGDCKDMTTLLCALGSEAGLDVRPALVSTWQNGRPDTSLPSPLHFNHAIAYWAGDSAGEVWMDATEKACPFGSLPWYDQGATILVVLDKGTGSLHVAPRQPLQTNRLTEVWEVHLDSSGSALVRGTMDARAVPAMELKGEMMDASPRERRLWFEDQLTRRLSGAVLDSLRVEGLEPAADSLHIAFRFHAPFAVRINSSEGVLRPVMTTAADLADELRPGSRSQPVRFHYGLLSQFSLHFHLPPGWSAASVPPDDSLVTPFGSFRLRSSSSSPAIRLETVLGLRGDQIGPERYGELRTFLDAARQMNMRGIAIRYGSQLP